MAVQAQILPRITVQASFFDVAQEITQGISHTAEDTWISVYEEEKPSVHGRVRVREGERRGVVELEARDGVEAELASSTMLRISCPSLKVPPTPVHFPLATPFSLRGGIDCFDISPNGALAVIGGKDGQARVVDCTGSRRPIDLSGHVGDLRDVKFFPSNEVVATCSSDMGVRIFSAKDGSNPRTLTGHTKAVTSLSIIGIGKLIASASLDGTVKIWQLGTASCLSTIRFTQPISAFVLASIPADNDEVVSSISSDLPPGLVAIVAHTNGEASVVSVSNQNRTIQSLEAGSSPLLSIAYDSTTQQVATGARNGTVSIFSLCPGASSKPITSFMRSNSAVLSLAFSNTDGSPSLLVGGEDGLPYRVGLGLSDGAGVLSVVEEFAGLDCDAVVVKEVAGNVWSAAADGKLRKYGGIVKGA